MECSDCGMITGFCFCDLVEKIDLDSFVTVLIPISEWYKTTNTGRLAKVALKNSKIVITGQKDSPFKPSYALKPGYENLLLFPGGNKVNKDFFNSLEKPMNLIVRDGTWQNAPRVIKRHKELFTLKRISLPIGKPSEYHLRDWDTEGQISTFEAIARILGLSAGLEIQEKLEWVFKVKVDRVLWSKGKLATEDVTGGVTDRAIAWRSGRL